MPRNRRMKLEKKKGVGGPYYIEGGGVIGRKKKTISDKKREDKRAMGFKKQQGKTVNQERSREKTNWGNFPIVDGGNARRPRYLIEGNRPPLSDIKKNRVEKELLRGGSQMREERK